MSIVTKTGDSGKTSLYNGDRVEKTHPRIEAVGALDELMALLGHVEEADVQAELFELGAIVANPESKEDMRSATLRLEALVETLEAELPPLRNFHLPGGHVDARDYHVARAVCRRAERRLAEVPNLPSGLLPYLNRLSDYLFLKARKANHDNGVHEVIWSKS